MRVGTTESHVVRAEPLTATAFAPFGQVLASERDGTATSTIELREGEVFALNILSYERRPLRCDHLNAHHRATQALVALSGKPTVLAVAPAGTVFDSRDALAAVRAFICDGHAAVNLALGTWHWGPYPVSDRVDLLNLQGAGFADDNEIAHLERDLGVVVEILL